MDGILRLGLDRISAPPALPRCDYVYFATPSRASFTLTREFVEAAQAIIAHPYNKLGQRMPLVQRLRAGDTILLAHGTEGKYEPIFRCTICASPAPVRTHEHIFDVFCYLGESLTERLRDANYEPDPVVQRFTGISVGHFQDLQHIKRTIMKPKGNNTLRRWDEVFREGSGRQVV